MIGSGIVEEMKMCKPLPKVDKELCTRCGLCVEACSCHSLEMGEQGPVFRCADESYSACPVDFECACLCEEVCPTGAIQCVFEIVLEDGQETSSRNDAGGQAQHNVR